MASQTPYRYRFRFISPLTFLVYMLLAIVLLVAVPGGGILKIIVALLIASNALLRAANQIVPWQYACGISLSDGMYKSFTIKRAPFGWRRISHSVKGFIRLFAIPSRGHLMLAFERATHEYFHASELEKRFTSTNSGDILWLTTPMVTDKTFPQRFVDYMENHNISTDLPPSPTILADVNIPQAYAAYIAETRQPLHRVVAQRLHQSFIIGLWLIGYNQFPDETDRSNAVNCYRFPAEQTTAAIGMVLVLGMISILSGLLSLLFEDSRNLTMSISLLALIVMVGPLIWLVFYSFNRQTGIILREKYCNVLFPLQYFNRNIPLEEIGIVEVVNIDRVGLEWLKPRRVAPGDDPRPPRRILLQSHSVENTKDCVEQIANQRVTHESMALQKPLQREIRRRAIVRRILLLFLFPSIGFILIVLIYRIAFALSAL